MSRDEIIEFGMPIITSMYRNLSRRYICNAYVRDRMWDEAVMVLLRVSQTYDPAKCPLKDYIYSNVRLRWWDLAYRRLPLERMVFGFATDDDDERTAEPIECAVRNKECDIIDCRELFNDLMRFLSLRQKKVVLGKINGQTFTEIAAELGCTKWNVAGIYRRSIAKLRRIAEKVA